MILGNQRIQLTMPKKYQTQLWICDNLSKNASNFHLDPFLPIFHDATFLSGFFSSSQQNKTLLNRCCSSPPIPAHNLVSFLLFINEKVYFPREWWGWSQFPVLSHTSQTTQTSFIRCYYRARRLLTKKLNKVLSRVYWFFSGHGDCGWRKNDKVCPTLTIKALWIPNRACLWSFMLLLLFLVYTFALAGRSLPVVTRM